MNRLILLTAAIFSISLLASTSNAQSGGPNKEAQPQTRGIQIEPQPGPGSYFDVSVWTDRDTYEIGDSISINFRSTRDGYVYIFSTSPDGETRQIFPNHYDRENKVSRNVTYRIPDSSYRLKVTPPTGRETLTIVGVPNYHRAMEKYKTFSDRDPFPRAAGAQAAIRAIVPDGKPNYGYAVDTKTIRIIGGRPGSPGDDNDHSDFGRLSITTSPDDAYVYVNRQYRGTTPVDLRRLRPGTYDVVIQKRGYETLRRRITVRSDSTARINTSLRRSSYRGDDDQGQGWGYFQ
jgi:hypothetical protein